MPPSLAAPSIGSERTTTLGAPTGHILQRHALALAKVEQFGQQAATAVNLLDQRLSAIETALPNIANGTTAGSALWVIEERTGVTGTVEITSAAERLFLRLDVVGDVTIEFPASMPLGGEIIVMVVQDTTGDRRVNWASEWRGSASLLTEVATGLTAMVVRGVIGAADKVFVTSVAQGVEV